MGIAIPGKTVFLIETAPWKACHAEAEILKWMNEWKKISGFKLCAEAKKKFSDALLNVQTPCMSWFLGALPSELVLAILNYCVFGIGLRWVLKNIIVNIASGNGLMPLGDKLLPVPMLSKFCIAIWHHKATNSWYHFMYCIAIIVIWYQSI